MPKSELQMLIDNSPETGDYRRFRKLIGEEDCRLLDELPARMHKGLARYFMRGVVPGNFLSAVLSNDLIRSFGAADDENRHIIWNYCSFLYNAAPAGSWGSPKAFEEWNRLGGIDGIKASQEVSSD